MKVFAQFGKQEIFEVKSGEKLDALFDKVSYNICNSRIQSLEEIY